MHGDLRSARNGVRIQEHSHATCSINDSSDVYAMSSWRAVDGLGKICVKIDAQRMKFDLQMGSRSRALTRNPLRH